MWIEKKWTLAGGSYVLTEDALQLGLFCGIMQCLLDLTCSGVHVLDFSQVVIVATLSVLLIQTLFRLQIFRQPLQSTVSPNEN